MSSEVAGTAGSGIGGALFLAEGVEVVWDSGRASEIEDGSTGGRSTLTGVRSWFALIPPFSVVLKNPDSMRLHILTNLIFYHLSSLLFPS